MKLKRVLVQFLLQMSHWYSTRETPKGTFCIILHQVDAFAFVQLSLNEEMQHLTEGNDTGRSRKPSVTVLRRPGREQKRTEVHAQHMYVNK